VLTAFFIELIKRALLTGHGALFVLPSFFFLEAVLRLLDGFILWVVMMVGDLFVDERVDVVCLFGGLNAPRLLLLVEVY